VATLDRALAQIRNHGSIPIFVKCSDWPFLLEQQKQGILERKLTEERLYKHPNIGHRRWWFIQVKTQCFLADWNNVQVQYQKRLGLKVDGLQVEIRERYFLDCSVDTGFESLGFVLAAGLFGKCAVWFCLVGAATFLFAQLFFKDDMFATALGLDKNT
jgi:hypothetical protein